MWKLYWRQCTRHGPIFPRMWRASLAATMVADSCDTGWRRIVFLSGDGVGRMIWENSVLLPPTLTIDCAAVLSVYGRTWWRDCAAAHNSIYYLGYLEYIANLHWMHLCYMVGFYASRTSTGYTLTRPTDREGWQKTNKLHGMAKMATLYGENIAADFDDKLGNCVYLSRRRRREEAAEMLGHVWMRW